MLSKNPTVTFQQVKSLTRSFHQDKIRDIENEILSTAKKGRDMVFLPGSTPFPVLKHFEEQGFKITEDVNEKYKLFVITW